MYAAAAAWGRMRMLSVSKEVGGASLEQGGGGNSRASATVESTAGQNQGTHRFKPRTAIEFRVFGWLPLRHGAISKSASLLRRFSSYSERDRPLLLVAAGEALNQDSTGLIPVLWAMTLQFDAPLLKLVNQVLDIRCQFGLL
mmetsp:Transcript_48765/g.105038  ORF Transcript_48765/g.105038 Transcript_48765/m.105038 type:complete len:142 (+) Transcript_48765:157-582(+)